ncbi:hypothetical protein HYU07_07770 [Candidatus Woesearchaeota archaeon]|nr:hypothetical protein [Candidatus Woesearchaeota archaeon]
MDKLEKVLWTLVVSSFVATISLPIVDYMRHKSRQQKPSNTNQIRYRNNEVRHAFVYAMVLEWDKDYSKIEKISARLGFYNDFLKFGVSLDNLKPIYKELQELTGLPNEEIDTHIKKYGIALDELRLAEKRGNKEDEEKVRKDLISIIDSIRYL